MRTRCLSFHAGYRCRHVGECCRAGWDIEVEPHIVQAVETRRILPVLSTAVAFQPLPEAGTVAPARTQTGDCGFHQADRCSLQQAGSETMLPSACRHFPRVYLRDARGVLLTLSHFCPTAAALLLDQHPVTIVEAAAPLALEEPIEGLDAREALPPLVRPGMLADIPGYAAWEEAVVRTFVETPDAHAALSILERATEDVRQWSPSHGLLADRVREAFATVSPDAAALHLSESFAVVRDLTGPHPLIEVPAEFEREWADLRDRALNLMSGPMARYLAASTFGNWIAYRGQGLRSIVAWLHACHDVVRVQLVRHLSQADAIAPADLIEPFRLADYIMVHTVDSLAFGRATGATEIV